MGHQAHHARDHAKLVKRALASRAVSLQACETNGALYVQPTAGASIPAEQQTTFQWDQDCLLPGTNSIDIYLYAPYDGGRALPIHVWQGVSSGPGSYATQLEPKWWNSTGDINLQLQVIPHGNEVWDTTNPAGPIFKATYTRPANITSDPLAYIGDETSTIVQKVAAAVHSLPGGSIAAAVIMPILAIIGIAVTVWYVRKQRKKTDENRRRWSAHVDRRMSTISSDWRSPGLSAGSRPESFFPRPVSSIPGERPETTYDAGADNVAGRGVRGLGGEHEEEEDPYGGVYDGEMREREQSVLYDQYAIGNQRSSRISFAPSTTGDRVSRISFAGPDGPHSRGTSLTIPRVGQTNSMMAQRNSSYSAIDAPPVPKLPAEAMKGGSGINPEDSELIMSPTQTDGPAPLANGDIDKMRDSIDMLGTSPSPTAMSRAPASSSVAVGAGSFRTSEEFRASVLQMPAISMIRAGNETPENMFGPGGLAPQAAAAATAANDYISNDYISHSHYIAPQQVASPPPNPAVALSPDDALRQYALASRQNTGPGAPGSNTMRTLYNPSGPVTTTPSVASAFPSSPFTASTITSPTMAGGLTPTMTGNLSPNHPGEQPGSNNPFRVSMMSAVSSAPSAYSHNANNLSTMGHEGMMVHHESHPSQGSGMSSSLNEDDVVGYNEAGYSTVGGQAH